MSSTTYPLMEAFYTIQGEGYNTGKAAYFLRLGGCDVGCVWCDVKDSWSANEHPLIDIDEMLGRVKASAANRVVVTGGEPAMYDLFPLTDLFIKNNIQCFIETSGAYKLTGKWDWVCVSPKKFKEPLHELLEVASELKVIVYNKSDFDWVDASDFNSSMSSVMGALPKASCTRTARSFPAWRSNMGAANYVKRPGRRDVIQELRLRAEYSLLEREQSWKSRVCRPSG